MRRWCTEAGKPTGLAPPGPGQAMRTGIGLQEAGDDLAGVGADGVSTGSIAARLPPGQGGLLEPERQVATPLQTGLVAWPVLHPDGGGRHCA